MQHTVGVPLNDSQQPFMAEKGWVWGVYEKKDKGNIINILGVYFSIQDKNKIKNHILLLSIGMFFLSEMKLN